MDFEELKRFGLPKPCSSRPAGPCFYCKGKGSKLLSLVLVPFKLAPSNDFPGSVANDKVGIQVEIKLLSTNTVAVGSRLRQIIIYLQYMDLCDQIPTPIWHSFSHPSCKASVQRILSHAKYLEFLSTYCGGTPNSSSKKKQKNSSGSHHNAENTREQTFGGASKVVIKSSKVGLHPRIRNIYRWTFLNHLSTSRSGEKRRVRSAYSFRLRERYK